MACDLNMSPHLAGHDNAYGWRANTVLGSQRSLRLSGCDSASDVEHILLSQFMGRIFRSYAMPQNADRMLLILALCGPLEIADAIVVFEAVYMVAFVAIRRRTKERVEHQNVNKMASIGAHVSNRVAVFVVPLGQHSRRFFAANASGVADLVVLSVSDCDPLFHSADSNTGDMQ